MKEQKQLQLIAKEIDSLKLDIINWEKNFFHECKTKEAIKATLSNFNPERDVIVTKEQLEVTSQLKQLAGLFSTVEQVAIQVNEVHAVQTGGLIDEFKKQASSKQLSPKQKMKAEQAAKKLELNLKVQQLQNFGLNNKLNKAKRESVFSKDV